MRIYIILYIVMKSTLRNSVKEVYKKSNNNNNTYGFNKSLINNNNENTSNNIAINNNNSNKNKNVNKNNSKNTNKINLNYSETKTKSIFNTSTVILIFIVIVFISIIGGVIYFKDKVLEIIKDTFFKEENERTQQEIDELKSELEENQNNQLLIEKELNRLREEKKEKEKCEKVTNISPKTEATAKKETKIKSNEELRKLYSKDQFVKEDGFCYIGTDNNMRQCVEVYSGDICESGDVYKRIDECLMPNNFKN